LMSDSLDRPLAWSERVALQGHLVVCRACRRAPSCDRWATCRAAARPAGRRPGCRGRRPDRRSSEGLLHHGRAQEKGIGSELDRGSAHIRMPRLRRYRRVRLQKAPLLHRGRVSGDS
ncbi:MAG: zf-HC2 domain-containing protein, partial [Gemmatimonadetes bacterium]|nr:zf-HC2 domain-containing protein [Gemmatimonadota bacterium]